MLKQLRNTDRTKYTLSIATIALLILSSTSSFAGEDSGNSPIPPASKISVGTGFGVASVVSLSNAFQLSKAASLETANHLSKVNELSTQAQKPYTQELENFETPKLKDAEAKIQKLEKEYVTLSAQIKAVEHAKNPSEQLKFQQLENQFMNQRTMMRDIAITKYQQDMAQIRSWFPFDVVKKVSNYMDHGGKEGPGVPKPTQAELEIWENRKIQATLSEYHSLDMQLKRLNAAKLRDANPSLAKSITQEAHVQPIGIQDAKKRLAQLGKEMTELKAWYPAHQVENARTRSTIVRQIASPNFNPTSKHFTVDEATELLSTHEKIQKVLTQGEEATKVLKKQVRPLNYMGALTLGASLASFGSAISDHFRKSETSARIERDNSSGEQSDTPSTGKFE